MLYIKFQCHGLFGSAGVNYFQLFTIYGHFGHIGHVTTTTQFHFPESTEAPYDIFLQLAQWLETNMIVLEDQILHTKF